MMTARIASGFLLLLLPALAVTGCGTSGGGGASGGEELTSSPIEFAPPFNVEKATITVFAGHGFQFTERGASLLVFQGAGGPGAQEHFGAWFADGVEVRVEIAITTPEYRTSVLHCRVYKSRGGPAGPWQATSEGRAEFKRMLKDIKALARAL